MVMGHSNMGSLFEIYIAGFHMQLFYMISGYLYRPNKYPRFGSYLNRKIHTIVIPYLFFAAITIIVCQLINVFSDHYYYSWKQLFEGMLFGNQAIFPITGAIWYLQSIFWIEIGYYFFEKIKSYLVSTIAIVLILGGSLVLSYNKIALPFSFDSALSGIVFYHIGFLIRKVAVMEKIAVFKNPQISIWLITFILNALLIYANRPVNPRTCEYSFFPLYYLNAVVGTWCWYVVASVLQHKKSSGFKIINGLLEYIGVNSIV